MTAPDTDWPGLVPRSPQILFHLSLSDVSGGKPVITVSTKKEVEGDGGYSYRVWFGDGNIARSHSDSLNGRGGGGNSRDSDPTAERKLFMATLFHAHDAVRG